ncbi:MAG TPA: helix-turn-helix domain-containing protein [Ignavibacteria bacterium]|nr:helix-turn-helix domain-containing protein [Ignavibacteria bacterium]HMR41559.1 helix-turn-helix domain-containing protein [Ignavibacteria bacterium]
MKGKNIFHLINKAVKDTRLKHCEVRILLCLISYNSFNKIFPSRETISKDTGIKSNAHISRHLNRLKDLGYIQIIRRKQNSNIYKLNLMEATNHVTINESLKEINQSVKAVTIDKLTEYSINPSFLDLILKINTGAGEVYKKCFQLLYCIAQLEKRKNEINNLQAYLLTTYRNLSYSQFHKDLFELKKTIKKIIRPDKEILLSPAVNY